MLYTNPQTPTPTTLTEGDIRAAHPHTSWPVPITAADVAAFGYVPVQPTPQPDHDPCTHTCTPAAPVQAAPDGETLGEGATAAPWVQAWQLTPRPEAEAAQLLADRSAAQAATARAERDRLLANTDHQLLPDLWAAKTPAQQTMLITYRQALRDVPEQPGFPYNITWP